MSTKKWAAEQGYGYVLLFPVSSGPNRSAGSIEKKKYKKAKRYNFGRKDKAHFAKQNPVYYATRIHWAKLRDFDQVKSGQPLRESRGIRVR